MSDSEMSVNDSEVEASDNESERGSPRASDSDGEVKQKRLYIHPFNYS